MALKLLCCCTSIRIKRTTVIKMSRGFYLSNGIVGIICYNILRVKSFFVIVFLQKQFEDAKLSAVVSEVVSQTPAPTTQAAGPPPSTAQHDNKELDDALDQLSDSLGQRQPDPDENKPVEDKVKEKAKAEHRDKLGERDDTIPPKYQHLLDDNKEGAPGKPKASEKPEASEKPAGAQDPIDALSGDLDSCPSTTETSTDTPKDKDKKPASSAKAPRNGGQAKDSTKAKEETSKPKADGKSTS